MSSYTDLSDNVNNDFSFVLRGKKYTMKYPTTAELEDIQTLNTEYEAIDKSSEEGKAMAETLSDAMYNFISGVDHDLNIKEELKKENIKVLQKFNHMIKTELAF
jgi:hypothetical protein